MGEIKIAISPSLQGLLDGHGMPKRPQHAEKTGRRLSGFKKKQQQQQQQQQQPPDRIITDSLPTSSRDSAACSTCSSISEQDAPVATISRSETADDIVHSIRRFVYNTVQYIARCGSGGGGVGVREGGGGAKSIGPLNVFST